MTPEAGGYADAVIVAAGSGVRMGSVDKGALDLAGRPLLRWAVERMRAARSVRRVIVVTAPERISTLQAQPWLDPDDLVIAGGARRQDSVTNGVRATDAEVVLVHDAARPLASPQLADRVAAAAIEHGAAIPVLPVPDSLKRTADGAVVAPIDRTGVVRAQTPQGARRDILLAALEHHATGLEAFGDEAEVLARDGVRVATVPGESIALKVTEPADLVLLRTMLPTERRLGWGSDSHPFGPRDGLRLGGIGIPEAPRLHGHSDGDVLLHALCGGLLSAAGLGDLGRLFPAGEARTRDIDSRDLVVSVVDRVRAAGLTPVSADIHLAGARPRLGGTRIDAMRATMADLLGIEPGRMAVTASTGNLSGDEGAGRVISATALVEVTSS